jgi:hypothetical protein
MGKSTNYKWTCSIAMWMFTRGYHQFEKVHQRYRVLTHQHMLFLPDFQGDFCMVLDMVFSDLKGHMFLFLPTESSTGKSQVEIFGGPKMGNVRKLSKLWNIVRFEAEETPNET